MENVNTKYKELVEDQTFKSLVQKEDQIVALNAKIGKARRVSRINNAGF